MDNGEYDLGLLHLRMVVKEYMESTLILLPQIVYEFRIKGIDQSRKTDIRLHNNIRV